LKDVHEGIELGSDRMRPYPQRKIKTFITAAAGVIATVCHSNHQACGTCVDTDVVRRMSMIVILQSRNLKEPINLHMKFLKRN
jgi:hypothetical protein